MSGSMHHTGHRDQRKTNPPEHHSSDGHARARIPSLLSHGIPGPADQDLGSVTPTSREGARRVRPAPYGEK